MCSKMYPNHCITLDGRLDEAVWNEVPEGTGFTTRKILGGEQVKDQTFVKILPCENRVYFGIKCMESDMDFAKSFASANIYAGNSLEIFFSPTNSTSEIYNLAMTIDGLSQVIYFVESGNNKVVYQPDWKQAVYVGEDYWSAEIEIPYSALYHTPNELWSDKWLVNVIRNQPIREKLDTGYAQKQVFVGSTWSKIDKSYLEAVNYQHLTHMPVRLERDYIRYSGANVELNDKTDDGYVGTVSVSLTASTADTFVFTTELSDPVTVTLQPGPNTVTAPCLVKELKRYNLAMEFNRVDDGEVFKYYAPITAEFEPIRIAFTLPEYRTNFYPGQDASKIVGKVYAAKPVTLTLTGGGMETQTVTPDKDGNFTFETPDFREGTEAILTASTDSWEIKKTMRYLAPTGHTMTWVSGGRLIVNGKPVLRRHMTAPFYKGGEAFARRYSADNLHITQELVNQKFTQPRWMIQGAEKIVNSKIGEATQDRPLSEEMIRALDEHLEACKDEDFPLHYAYDEPEYNNASLIYMRQFCEYVAEKDPYHVIRICTHDPLKYMPYCDYVATDPYLGVRDDGKGHRYHGQPINTLKKFIDPFVELGRTDKFMGFATTCFAYKAGAADADYPTFDEMLAHTWVAVNHGAKAITSYAYHDLNDRPRLYEGTRYLYSSLEALEEQILTAEIKPLLCNDDIDAYMYEYGDNSVFVAVNMSDKPQKFTLEGIDGLWHHFRHNEMLSGNTFELKPYGVLIGTRQAVDVGMPTYQETQTLIDRLEAERMNSRSLLFEREKDITITASTNDWTKYKLFDGVRDNLGYEMRGENLFVELDLTKVKPTFATIGVYGWHLEGMQIKLLINGQWITAEPATAKTEQFSAVFELTDSVSPNALRLEFPQQKVELYEIEVY